MLINFEAIIVTWDNFVKLNIKLGIKSFFSSYKKKMSAEFIESTHDKKQLCYLGYRYCFKRKNRNRSEYWICTKCTATATSYSDLSFVVRGEHTHLPDKLTRLS